MPSFEWISPQPLPPRFDLRSRGWTLVDDRCAGEACAGLVDTSVGVTPECFAPAVRRRALALDLPTSGQRAVWMGAGFADALPCDADLAEIEQRALRALVACGQADAMRRDAGPLSLDLIERDARCSGRRLHLHPREFALLWRLWEARGGFVSRDILLRDVWHLRHIPETNTLAVHVHRLRRKLDLEGLASLIETDTAGPGYRLALKGEQQLADDPDGLPELTTIGREPRS